MWIRAYLIPSMKENDKETTSGKDGTAAAAVKTKDKGKEKCDDKEDKKHDKTNPQPSQNTLLRIYNTKGTYRV